MSDILKVGVVGYCYPTKFNLIEAWEILNRTFDKICDKKEVKELHIIGGLTDIPSVHRQAYYIAKQRGWNIGGIAPKCAKEFVWFPMNNWGDTLKITGENWQDESEEFINSIDILVRVGGNEQSRNEAKQAKQAEKSVFEIELPVEK